MCNRAKSGGTDPRRQPGHLDGALSQPQARDPRHGRCTWPTRAYPRRSGSAANPPTTARNDPGHAVPRIRRPTRSWSCCHEAPIVQPPGGYLCRNKRCFGDRGQPAVDWLLRCGPSVGDVIASNASSRFRSPRSPLGSRLRPDPPLRGQRGPEVEAGDWRPSLRLGYPTRPVAHHASTSSAGVRHRLAGDQWPTAWK